MQEFTIFDMVVLGITLVLGLKGLFRGLIKEVFGIIGIIGAIFVASRISEDIGDLIAPVLALENETTIKLIGFIVALIGFWIIVYLLGVIVSKIFSASGLGIVDRVFGFIFGAGKVFLIFSVIAYALYQVESFKKAIDEKTAGSVVMPHLISVGSYIIKLDTTKITDSVGGAVDKVVETTKEATSDNKPTSQKVQEALENTKNEVSKTVEDTVNDVKKSVEQEVINKVEKQLEDTKAATKEQIDTVKEKLNSIANTQENKEETN
ncbi:CvpA family protein [Arcobacter sp. YIC-464]|uniref:CvpA family protein n=1 Tax=Arcobacter sp. YIC-464 TaxID=3376631 RepID=UPI003C181C23